LLEDDHRSLIHTMKQLTNILQTEQSQTEQDIDTKTIKSLVFALRDRLLTHFHLEVNMEILSDLMEQIPSCKLQAEKIFSEHKFFVEIIDAIYHLSINLHPNNRNQLNELIDKYEEFKKRIKKHEEKEDQLMHQIFNQSSSQ
ncbi:MAG: hypothetical protein Q8Q33_06630, partial [Chlamydiota bacterium]|nr:hypothetical protein [Chlamydiota bacterium]